MDAARKLVIFPTDQFYAVIGNITLPVNPYSMSLTDILTDQSAMTHRKGDHEHRPGKIFLSEAECYGLFDNTQRVCSIM
ncbi:MAG TPA: hypothetical protein VI389_09600, partial [Geobacteraceae bacterium]